MKLGKIMKKTLMAAVMVLGATSAHASLSTSYTFNGNGNWSLDGCGSNTTNPVCTIDAVVPTGSTIVAAFLYSSNTWGNTSVPSVDFDGTTYSSTDWTNLGSTGGLTAFRTDVTAQVAAAIGGGSATPYTFTINSESPNNSIDGEVLAIIYSNPAESERTIAFLDGFSAMSGDTTSVNLADPLTAAELADPNFEAMLSLGIGYGAQGDGQRSEVTVNGAILTTCAGGQDDGVNQTAVNGGLITVGGLGDSAANDHDCSLSGPRQDDELYTLTPFLNAGDTSITIDTINPSNDDNIFFAAVNITAVAAVCNPETDPDQCQPPSTSVPEPSTLALLSLGLLGFGATRRKKAA